MASGGVLEVDLFCPLCRDIFENPVVLSCGHSFCSSCIQDVWNHKQVKVCPDCRRRSSMEHLPVNLKLKTQCESFLQKKTQRSTLKAERLCSLHHGQLKLFCLDDQQLMCLLCQESKKHTNHRFRPVDEAAMQNKGILKDHLKSLQDKLRGYEFHERSFYKIDEDLKFKAQSTERMIRKEFEELHQILLNEETARIKDLTEEERWRSQRIKDYIQEMNRRISSLKHSIRETEEQMKAEDVSFLQNFSDTLQRAQFNLSAPGVSPAISSDFTDFLRNLKVTVLQKMQDSVVKTSNVNIEDSAHTFPRRRPQSYAEVSEKTLSFHYPMKYDKDRYWPNSGENSKKTLVGQKSKEIQQEDSRAVDPMLKNDKTKVNEEPPYYRPPLPRRPSSFKPTLSSQTSSFSSVQSSLNKQKSISTTSLITLPKDNDRNVEHGDAEIQFSSFQSSLNKESSVSTTSLKVFSKNNSENEEFQDSEIQFSSVQSTFNKQKSRSTTSFTEILYDSTETKELHDSEIHLSSDQSSLNRQTSVFTTSLTSQAKDYNRNEEHQRRFKKYKSEV